MNMLEVSRTEVHRKLIIEFQMEEVNALDTPRDVGENSMVQEFSSNSKNDETPIADSFENNWRPKTRSKNKSRMKMNSILNPKFKKNVVTIIEDSSSDEYLQVVDEEYHTIDQTLG